MASLLATQPVVLPDPRIAESVIRGRRQSRADGAPVEPCGARRTLMPYKQKGREGGCNVLTTA